MSQAQQQVKVKLEIKGSPHFKFEYEGSLDDATNLAIQALKDLRKHVFFAEE